MDHLDAVRTRAAERYALKQMTPAEIEIFEEHFFSCAECAEEVRWISVFEQNAKRVVGKKVRETPAEFVAVAALEAGTDTIVFLPEYTAHLILTIPIPTEGWNAKHISLATGAGTARFTMKVPTQQLSEGKVHVMLLSKELDPGRHILTLVSDEGDYLEYAFSIKLE